MIIFLFQNLRCFFPVILRCERAKFYEFSILKKLPCCEPEAQRHYGFDDSIILIILYESDIFAIGSDVKHAWSL